MSPTPIAINDLDASTVRGGRPPVTETFAIVDETDSDRDIDTLGSVAAGVQEVRKEYQELGTLAINDDHRLIDRLEFDLGSGSMDESFR
jgi:hypothetical protein